MRRNRLWAAAGLGLICALWMTGLKLYWSCNQPDGGRFYGFMQGDEKFYACLIRAAAASPNGMTYAYPWDLSPKPAAIFFQLPIMALGLASRAMPAARMDALLDGFRLIFAPLMFAALAWAVRSAGVGRRLYWPAFLAAALGGGIAWLFAWGMRRPSGPGLLEAFYAIEFKRHGYHWWFLNSFRNVYYPLETFYHFLFYGMVAALMRRKRTLAASLFAVGLASNPFLGMHMSAVLIPALALRLAGRKPRRQISRSLAAAICCAALFLAYYQLFLPSHPVGASLAAQHREAFPQAIGLGGITLGSGLFGAAFVGSWLWPSFIQAQLRSRRARILLLWMAGSVALQHNGLFLPHPIQPMHFTRGYVYVALAIWSFRMIQFAMRGERRKAAARFGVGFAFALAALSLPDNVLFVARSFTAPPETFSVAEAEVMDHFRGYRGGRVLTDQGPLNVMLTGVEGIQTFWAERFTTPHFDARLREVVAIVTPADAADFCRRNGIGAIVLTRSAAGPAAALAGSFAVAFENSKFVVFTPPADAVSP